MTRDTIKEAFRKGVRVNMCVCVTDSGDLGTSTSVVPSLNLTDGYFSLEHLH